MTPFLLTRLRCPYCYGRLIPFEKTKLITGSEYGVLSCHCGRYPVVAGIPILKKSRQIKEVIALLDEARYNDALLNLITPPKSALVSSEITFPVLNAVFNKLIYPVSVTNWRKRADLLLSKQNDQTAACKLLNLYYGNSKSENYNGGFIVCYSYSTATGSYS
jgi:uncharacterized protein YbaR (Trm112 family)